LIITADDGIGEITLAAGEAKPFPYSIAGPFVGQATVDNTVTASWVLPETYGLPNTGTATSTATCRVGSQVELLKKTQGNVDPTKSWTFSVYEGPDGFGSPPLASSNTSGDADGVLEFGDVNLDPLKTYTICELGVPAGYSTFWQVDTDGDGVADTTVVPYNPNADDDPSEDVGNRCVEFGAGTGIDLLTAGGTLVFEVNNQQPGGAPRTPGYWKNWNTCTGGGQQYTAEANGGWEEGFWLLEDVLDPNVGGGIVWDDILSDDEIYPIETCEIAVLILDKRRVHDGKKDASDPLVNLATHLLAAQLNFGAGACTTQEALDAALAAEELLDAYDFLLGYSYKKNELSKADASLANELAGYLDDYNNGMFCGDGEY